MHDFGVWAPKAQRVAVKIGERSYPMSHEGDRGWWRVSVEEAGQGSDYGFVLDDDPKAWPDPRSLWQPHGVHGASRVYDQAAFVWTDRGWDALPLSSAVIYESHVGTFTPSGTFDSMVERLEYLVKLGITHVELMPVAAFPGGRDGDMTALRCLR
jgi:maltooligosyltrehalose trehalohydrolase